MAGKSVAEIVKEWSAELETRTRAFAEHAQQLTGSGRLFREGCLLGCTRFHAGVSAGKPGEVTVLVAATDSKMAASSAYVGGFG